MSSIKIKFVSRKISKIRWQPKSSSVFVTGSYNDEKNIVSLWKFPDPVHMTDDIDNEVDDDPFSVFSEETEGCVSDLKVVSDELIFTASSLGSISIFTYSHQSLKHALTWKSVHSFKMGPASTTGISVKGQELASVGEDGKLCLFNFQAEKKIRDIESSDMCSFTCVSHLRHQEVVAGNSLGYLRLWDLRSSTDTSSCLLTLSREQKGVSSMTLHPTQPHILATGYEDGSLCIWDMRQDRKPMSLLEGHNGAITELLFHPTNPELLFTCSLDGSVWQWDATKLGSNPLPAFPSFSESNGHGIGSPHSASIKGNPWLNCDANKHKLEVTSLSAQSWSCVNSMDVSGSILIWGTDNEELCIQNDITI